MTNINYFLHEEEATLKNNSLTPDEWYDLIDIVIKENEDNDNDTDNDNDIQLEIYYKNYGVKALTQVLQYYGIYKSKMIKDEMIQVLVFYETDIQHAALVQRRLRLWQNIKELKTDPYFSKYIMFEP